MDEKKVRDMFYNFNQKYFYGKLGQVRLSLSTNMTLCTGKTYYREKQRICSISLSQPLLSQRPPEDTINTLLHEMIHAYLFVTEDGNQRMGHGPLFKEHMTRINKLHGSKITVFHNFQKEVDKFRVHVYRCDGPCIKKRPYFGVIRRAVTRPPGPTDKWWARHSQECGGTFHKVEGPDISPDKARNARVPLKASPVFSGGTPSPNHTPSQRRIDPGEAQSRGAISDTSKFVMSGVRKRLSYNQAKNKDDSRFSEDQVIQKIKKRHAHSSHSILLPKNEGYLRWREPTLECGTWVDGRVNYNYKIRSNIKFNIHKYLERYRAVKKAEEKTYHKTEVLQSPHASLDAHKFTRHQPTGDQTPRRTETTRDSQASFSKKCTTSLNTSGSSQDTVPPVVCCWNCGVNLLVPKHLQHSQQVTPVVIKEEPTDNVSPTLVPCPSCDEKFPQDQINSHLDECLLPFTDEF